MRAHPVSARVLALVLSDPPGGQRTLFLSGSVHPPRSPPAAWAGVLARAKSHGLNMVEVYVFWNFHERVEAGQYEYRLSPGSPGLAAPGFRS